MDLDELFRAFLGRPVYQRIFLAFTVGLFLSCAARMAGAEPSDVRLTPAVDATATVTQRTSR
jgi:hypothetical protein